MNLIKRKITITSVYYVDDDYDDRILFAETLFEIDRAVNLTLIEGGPQLMEILSPKFLPDVIFLNINMPCRNGFECLRDIRNSSEMEKVKVIMYSTSNSRIDIIKSFELGADYYITKPASFTAVKEVIKKAMSLKWDLPQNDQSTFLLN